jgi:hypothetical protein
MKSFIICTLRQNYTYNDVEIKDDKLGGARDIRGWHMQPIQQFSLYI